MNWFGSEKPFLPPPPEGYRWYAEEGSSYKFRLMLVESEKNGYPVAIYTEYADHEWGLPWAARRILKQYRKNRNATRADVVRRLNETDWTEQ